MTHTHHAGLVTTWKLKINRRHYIEVFIWDDKESMYAANDFNASKHRPERVRAENNNEHNYDAYAAMMIWFVPKDAGQKIRAPKKFGEIHVVYDNYGIGIVTHEVAHIASYWGDFMDWDIYGKHNEKFAHVTGELNRQFYVQHWKKFPG